MLTRSITPIAAVKILGLILNRCGCWGFVLSGLLGHSQKHKESFKRGRDIPIVLLVWSDPRYLDFKDISSFILSKPNHRIISCSRSSVIRRLSGYFLTAHRD